MTENNHANVPAAFEMLLEEIEAEIAVVSKAGARAFDQRDFDGARNALRKADDITAFRQKVVSLRKEWEPIAPPPEMETEEPAPPGERAYMGRLQRGQRTPEAVMNRPILQSLVELGGAARIGQVMEQVERKLKGVLKDIDFEPLTSDPDSIRWRNTAQWARAGLVSSGLMKQDSPRGIWEISDAGREALEKGTV